MTAPPLPPWAATTVAVLVLGGAALTMIGAFGLIRLRTFYERAHAPTIGSSGGIMGISLAAIVCFSQLDAPAMLAPALIFLFVTLTMPITLMLLARAALFRDRAERNPDVPPPIALGDIREGEWHRSED